jgi:hypothetical protein
LKSIEYYYIDIYQKLRIIPNQIINLKRNINLSSTPILNMRLLWILALIPSIYSLCLNTLMRNIFPLEYNYHDSKSLDYSFYDNPNHPTDYSYSHPTSYSNPNFATQLYETIFQDQDHPYIQKNVHPCCSLLGFQYSYHWSNTLSACLPPNSHEQILTPYELLLLDGSVKCFHISFSL